MPCRITGLKAADFAHLWGLNEAALRQHRALRVHAEAGSALPDRIEMREGRAGESLILVNHVCQPADSPYYATHAVYVREGAEQRFDAVGVVPQTMATRLISLRAFDEGGMMVATDAAEGAALPDAMLRILDAPGAAYVHANFAKAGCYAGLIRRA